MRNFMSARRTAASLLLGLFFLEFDLLAFADPLELRFVERLDRSAGSSAPPSLLP